MTSSPVKGAAAGHDSHGAPAESSDVYTKESEWGGGFRLSTCLGGGGAVRVGLELELELELELGYGRTMKEIDRYETTQTGLSAPSIATPCVPKDPLETSNQDHPPSPRLSSALIKPSDQPNLTHRYNPQNPTPEPHD